MVFCLKPVEKKLTMRPQHLCYFLHRFKPGTHGSRTPFIQKLSRPGRRFIFPEKLEVFFKQIGQNRFQITLQKISELGLLGSHLIDCFVHMAGNVKTVQYIYRFANLLRHYLQVRLPHVGADKSKRVATILSQPIKETKQGFRRPITTDPEQPLASVIQLIDHGGKLESLLPGNFINSDSGDSIKISMFKPPGHRHLHRSDDAVPTGVKDIGNLFPGQPFRPPRKKPRIGSRQAAFALRPGNRLPLYPARWAINPAHGVKEKHRNPPQRYKLKATAGKSIVSRAPFTAAGTNRLTVDSRFDLDLDAERRVGE